MPAPRVIFGRGLPALIAANALHAQGASVLWLDPDDAPAVEPSLDPPPWRARAGEQARLEGLLGPLRPAQARARSVVFEGQARPLPLGRRDRAQLLGLNRTRRPLEVLLRARARSVIAEAIGGGQEERSYEDWMLRRFGAPLHQQRFADYASRRWGASAAELSASTARWHHFVDHDGALVEPVGGTAALVDGLSARFRAAGGERRQGAAPERLQVRGGRVTAILLRSGETVPVEGPLWLQADPSTVASWLEPGALPAGLLHVAQSLQNADRLLLDLPDPDPAAEAELHLLDPAPFWMLRRAAGRITLVGTLDRSAPTPTALQPWLDGASALCGPLKGGEGLALRRIPGAQPQWRPRTLAWLRDVVVAWDRLGLVPFGRAGTMADLDLAEQARYALLITEGEADVREALRQVAEPSSSEADLLASTRPVITR